MENVNRFIIVGTGGIGSWFAQGLARMCQYKAPNSIVILVDGDTYEPKNKERQAFKQYGNKAKVLAAELTPEFPDTFFVPEAAWIVAEDSPRASKGAQEGEEEGIKYLTPTQLLQENDVVYTLVDNFAARQIIFSAAYNYQNIDILTGGNDDKFEGNIYHFRRRNGVNITEDPAEKHVELANPQDRNPGELSCQERQEVEGGTQLLATNMAVAAHLIARTHRAIFGDEMDPATAEVNFDLALGLSQPNDITEDVSILTTV